MTEKPADISSLISSFISKYLGKQVEYHSFDPRAKFQCVDLVNQYIVEVLKLDPVIGTHAKDFPSKVNLSQFEVHKNTPAFIPKVGDIANWNKYVGGGAGHIAVVRDNKATLSTFNSVDQNWSKPLYVTLETHSYTNVTHFLRPKVVKEIAEELGFTKLYSEEEMTRMRLERDDNHNKYSEETRRHEETKERLKETERRLTEEEGKADARKNLIEDLSEILKCEANIESVREACKTAVQREHEAVKQVDKLNEVLVEQQATHKQATELLLNEIAEWKIKIQKQAETFENRIKKLETEKAQTVPLTSILSTLFKNLKKLR